VVQPTLYPNCVCTKSTIGFQEYEYIMFTTFGYICREWIIGQELETVQTNNTSHSYIQSTAKDGDDAETLAHSDIGLIDLYLWSCTLLCCSREPDQFLVLPLPLFRSSSVMLLASCFFFFFFFFLWLASFLVIVSVVGRQVSLAFLRPNIWMLILTDSKAG
jgi:hypothetical protein